MLGKGLLFFAYYYPWIPPVLILFATGCFLLVSRFYQQFGVFFGPAIFVYIVDLKNKKLCGGSKWNKLIATLGRLLFLFAIVILFLVRFLFERLIK